MPKQILFDIKLLTEDARKLNEIEDQLQLINRQQKDLVRNNKQATTQFQKNAIAVKQLKKEQSQLQQAIIKQNNAQKANLKTIGGINAALAQERQRIKDIVIGTKEFKDSSTRIKDLENKQRQFNAEIGRGKTFVGEYARGFKEAFTKVGLAIGGVVVALRSLKRGYEQITAKTIEINTAQNRANVVFGQSVTLINKLAKETAISLGQTEAEFVKSTAAVGDLLIPLGFTRKEAAEMSVQMNELGAALKLFTGDTRSTEEISNLLGKALLGERESLKGLGVAISEAEIKQRLMDQGLQDLTGSTLAQAKAQATIEILFEKSRDAMASLRDETTTLNEANSQLSANLRQIGDDLAVSFTPILEKVTSELIPVTGKIRSEIQFLTKGTWAERLRLIANKVIKNVSRLIIPFVGLLEKITGKKIVPQFNLEPIKEDIKVVHDETEKIEEKVVTVNKKAQDAAEKFAAALERIRQKETIRIARELKTEDEEIKEEIDFGEPMDLQLEKYKTDKEYEQELFYQTEAGKYAILKEFLLKGKISHNEYADKVKALDKEIEENHKQLQLDKLATMEATFGLIADIFEKGSAEYKIFATAEALISTYLAANKALASAPPPFNFFLMAATIAKGLINVAKIKGFDSGGRISSGQTIRRRNGDNVLITARKGEVILNEDQQRMLGGDRTFKAIGVPGFAGGGAIPSQMMQNNLNIDYDVLSRAIARNMATQKVFVSVNEINQAQAERKQIEVLGDA